MRPEPLSHAVRVATRMARPPDHSTQGGRTASPPRVRAGSLGDTAVGVDVDRVRACGDGVDPCGPRGRAAAWSTRLSRSARPFRSRSADRVAAVTTSGSDRIRAIWSRVVCRRRAATVCRWRPGAAGRSPPYRPERERNGPDPRGQAGVEVHHADACAGRLARTTGLSTTLTFFSDSLGTKSVSDKRGNPSAGGWSWQWMQRRQGTMRGPPRLARTARGRAVPRPRAGREDPWSRPAVLRRDRRLGRRGETARVETWRDEGSI